jgi:hypothetical protein
MCKDIEKVIYKKTPTLSDKELIKWASILGSYRMKELYFMNKIILTKEQLDKLIEIGRYENEKEVEKFINEYDKYIKKKTLHK